MTTLHKLFVFIIGETLGGTPFCVNIAGSELVDDLKVAIKKSVSPILNDVGASRLTLWKVCYFY
jgi:hypothetical protein